MLLQIPVLTPAQVIQCRTLLEKASWIDGRVTAGHQSTQVKYNQQLPEHHPVAQKVGDIILTALEQNSLFISGALPLKIFPPLFNKYGVGEAFGTHIDNAIRSVTGTPYRIRTDLSATLFLSSPEDYDGGELVIEDVFGVQKIKLPAGQLILYPASSLHHVTAVTKGTRLASFFWIQSMIRDDGKRTILFDLDRSIQSITQDIEKHPCIVSLTGVYHNLLRQWAEM